MTLRETSEEIEAAAARWVWRLDREERTPDLHAELETWLAGDSRRRGAFLQAEATWAMLDRGRVLAGRHARPPLSRSGTPRRALMMGGGAAIAASFAAFAYLALPHERYGTTVGEIRRLPLKDGSIVAINTQSAIEVDLKPKLRRVRLQRGEAWFQVARNSQRPFVVEAGSIRAQAIGTAFSVRRFATGADVLVSEGVVEVWVAGAEGHRVRILAGQSAQLATDAAITERESGPSEIDRQLAWRSGQIDLAGETLAEAAAEFNRYNTRQLVIADPRLAQERFYGVFRTDDPEGFANAVQHILGATVTRDNGAEIRISATAA